MLTVPVLHWPCCTASLDLYLHDVVVSRVPVWNKVIVDTAYLYSHLVFSWWKMERPDYSLHCTTLHCTIYCTRETLHISIYKYTTCIQIQWFLLCSSELERQQSQLLERNCDITIKQPWAETWDFTHFSDWARSLTESGATSELERFPSAWPGLRPQLSGSSKAVKHQIISILLFQSDHLVSRLWENCPWSCPPGSPADDQGCPGGRLRRGHQGGAAGRRRRPGSWSRHCHSGS